MGPRTSGSAAWKFATALRRRRRRPRRWRFAAGFSLIEALVSMAVLVIGVLGLFASVVETRRLDESTALVAARARVLNDAVERLKNGALPTRAQEFVAKPTLTAEHETVSVRFPVATLTKALPKYSSTTSPFLDVDKDGYLDVVPANAAAPGILPVQLTVTADGVTVVVESLLANR